MNDDPGLSVERLNDGRTVEYAVQHTPEVEHLSVADDLDSARSLLHWLDLADNGCAFCPGPHRVVQRTVTDWVPVGDEETE